MNNLYKGSVRDNIKHLTVNGETLLTATNWGWYGPDTHITACAILLNEHNVTAANKYGSRLAREFLATCPEEGFVLTSEQLNQYIEKFKNEETKEKQ